MKEYNFDLKHNFSNLASESAGLSEVHSSVYTAEEVIYCPIVDGKH